MGEAGRDEGREDDLDEDCGEVGWQQGDAGRLGGWQVTWEWWQVFEDPWHDGTGWQEGTGRQGEAAEELPEGGDPCSLAAKTDESKDASWSSSMEESREGLQEEVDPTPESCDAALRRCRRCTTSLEDVLGQGSSSALPAPSRPTQVLLKASAERWGGEAAAAASISSCRRSILTSSRA